MLFSISILPLFITKFEQNLFIIFDFQFFNFFRFSSEIFIGTSDGLKDDFNGPQRCDSLKLPPLVS